MQSTAGPVELLGSIEFLPRFRADVDHNGRWHVWRQLTTNGWATLQRCPTREEAVALAQRMNASHGNVDDHTRDYRPRAGAIDVA